MRLEEHISQLLFQHDCVIVPNFGAFISNTANVAFDEKTNTFISPRKELSFNTTLTKSDGVLVNKIVEDEPMSFENAQTFLNEQVYFWQEHLKNGKVLTLQNIGSLQFNDAGKIDFKPENAQNYFIAAYGLSNLQANYILDSSKTKTSNKHMSKFLAAASLIPIIVGGFLYFNTPQPVQEFVTEQWSGLVLPMIGKDDATKTEKPTVQYDVYNMPQTIAEPSLVEYQIAETVTKTDTIETPKKVEITVVKETKLNETEKEITAIVKEKPSTKEVVKTETKKLTKVEAPKTAEKKVEDKKEIATKTTVKSNNKKYQVIAASLKRQEDADRLVGELKKQGYKDAGVSYVKGRYYYVTYSSFNNIEDAQKYMNDVNKKSPGTWVRTEN
ncbi:SPOR domain-containing protein [Empedobacter sp. GD03865]|uniref:HU domain-containing protein n=1 Tax=Empedobacter sp. GD03865 TaxID=2975392 RepID=UPI002448C985|nr:SPOR domain-containing protein [Empedobacter sp. GD03865]MDH0659984.1 SPOR domain-containing protein [Empedobacter sp. GD03865]